MAKQKPSGDPIPNEPGADGVTSAAQPIDLTAVAETALATEAAPVQSVGPDVLPPGHVWIDLLDANAMPYARRSIPAGDATFKITIDGQSYRHVSTFKDGVWGYMVD